MSILGNAVVRREDPRFLTGAATYVDDLRLDDVVEVVYVRSPYAHAEIRSVDVDDARSAPGVVDVVTGAEVHEALGLAPHVLPIFDEGMRKPFLAVDRIRHVGEPVVAVIAESRAAGQDAAELVFVDYEPLEPLVDPEVAARDDVLLFPEVGTNVVQRLESEQQPAFDDCEVVVAERIVNQRLTAAPIEPRSGAAWWTDDGRLVHYSACQGGHPTKALLQQVFGLDAEDVRVVVPDVGGGFGAKSRTYPEEAVLGLYARRVGRPVRWTETRSENVAAMPQGRGQIQYARLGGTRDGRITAYQLDVVQDCGAYPIIGAVLPNMTQRMLCGTYDLDGVGFTSTTTVTSTVSITAYRGAGRPEATVAIERMIDRFAAEIGMDPAEVRRRNLLPRFTEAITTGIGTQYDVGDHPESLRLALDAAGYDDLRREQAERRASGDPVELGIGVGMYVEITAGAPAPEYGSIELLPDGRFRVVSGSTPYGQGHDTTWAMLVADRLGVDLDRIEVVMGDTDLVPRGGLTVGSRSAQVAGSALAAASTQLVDRGRQLAADRLEAAVGDVVLDGERGAFHVVGSASPAVTWTDLADDLDAPLIESNDFTAPMPTFPSGCHVAEVEVDVEIGRVRVRRLVAVDDAGRLLNPLIAEGQVHGGIAQGIAQVLFEGIHYDADGNLVTSNFLDYLVPSAAELPSYELVHQETPTWVNELGAKGIGESGTIGSIPAVYNAVVDALAHLGVRHLETPITPERIWQALR